MKILNWNIRIKYIIIKKNNYDLNVWKTGLDKDCGKIDKTYLRINKDSSTSPII